MEDTSTNVVDQSWRSSRRVLFVVLFLINVLNYADRFVLPAVATEIKAAVGLSDTQIGLIGTAFLLVYAITAVPLGVVADRSLRTRVVSLGVAVWSVATVVTGFTRTFAQLFAARAFLGIGEASYFPASTSLLADAFPHGSRGRLMSWWNFATPIGVFLGFAAGGVVGARFGWPFAFYLTAAPGLILAAVISMLREPARGSSERLRASPESGDALATMRKLLRVRSLVASILAQSFSFFVLGGVSFWIPTYMHDHFKLDTATAGILSGVVIVVSGGVGTLIGGYVADHLLARGHSGARLVVPGLGFLGAAPFILLGILAPSLGGFLIFFGLAAGLLQTASGPLTALSQDVVVPARRAQAVAISLLITHLLGDAFAPTALGALSDALGGLERALLVAPVAVVAAASVALVGSRWVALDRKRVLLEAAVAQE